MRSNGQSRCACSRRRAESAAAAILVRRSRSSNASARRGSTARISRAAATAWFAEMGLAFTFQRLSRAWDRASRPVLTVSCFGFPSMSLGSISACSGYRFGRASEYLCPNSVSQTVAQEVTSLPVPAVVGTAMIGVAESSSAAGAGLQEPEYGRELAARRREHLRGIDRPLDPPPRATITSGSLRAAAKRAACPDSSRVSGLGRMSLTVSTSSPARPRSRSASSAKSASG